MYNLFLSDLCAKMSKNCEHMHLCQMTDSIDGICRGWSHIPNVRMTEIHVVLVATMLFLNQWHLFPVCRCLVDAQVMIIISLFLSVMGEDGVNIVGCCYFLLCCAGLDVMVSDCCERCLSHGIMLYVYHLVLYAQVIRCWWQLITGHDIDNFVS